MISSITNQAQVRFMVCRGTETAHALIQFMSWLIKGSERKVFLLLGTLKVHGSQTVKKWLVTKKEQIEVFYLPSEFQELNPGEYLNSNVKEIIRSRLPARSEKELTKKTRSFMRTLQNRPELVCNSF